MTPPKSSNKKAAKAEPELYRIETPDLWWPHTSEGTDYGTKEGEPLRFVHGEIHARSKFPVSDKHFGNIVRDGYVTKVDSYAAVEPEPTADDDTTNTIEDGDTA